eukprot:tig00021434_g21309.t1
MILEAPYVASSSPRGPPPAANSYAQTSTWAMARAIASVNPTGEDNKGEPFSVKIALEVEAGAYAVTASWVAKGALFGKLKKLLKDAEFKWANKEWVKPFKSEKEARAAYEDLLRRLPSPAREAAAAAPAAAPAGDAASAAPAAAAETEAEAEAHRLESFEASGAGMRVHAALECEGAAFVVRCGWELEKQFALFKELKELVKGAGFAFSFKSKLWSKSFKEEAPARAAFAALVEGMPAQVMAAADGGGGEAPSAGAKRGRGAAGEEGAPAGEKAAKRRSSGGGDGKGKKEKKEEAGGEGEGEEGDD